MRLGILLLFLPLVLLAQNNTDAEQDDLLYLEDQFYASVTYNFMLNRPEGVSQRKASYGLNVGFIKDLPLNRDRNLGLGIGFGLSMNNYYTNMRAFEDDEQGIQYEVPSVAFKRSKLEVYALEVPLEFRWRNSNPKDYSFWRVYSGIQLGYVWNARSKFFYEDKSLGANATFSNTDIKSFQYGLTFNFGYHNFNMHVYYSLSGLFNSGVFLGSEELNIRPLQIGFVFYIL